MRVQGDFVQEGQADSSQARSAWVCLAPVIRPDGPAPKGQESLAQGLPWVSRYKRLALEGLEIADAIRSKGSESILAASGGPFRANSGGGITQGKPWAMLSWPLRATDGKRPNSSGPYDAKHI
jgi:hypothetical protein